MSSLGNDKHQTEQAKLDLAAIRERLKRSQGKEYWRSLEEVAETKEFQGWLHREFPRQASEWLDSVSRRRFLKLMGASMALAGLNACSADYPSNERVVPYVREPENLVLGRPLFYATAMPLGGSALGLLAEQHEGRPTKLEGNPQHPASLGHTDVYAQASILTMYDPDRSQTVQKNGAIGAYTEFLGEIREQIEANGANGGAGLAILTETVSSPTLASQLQAIQEQYPRMRWVQYEPLGRDGARSGSQLAFGRYLDPLYNFLQADVVLSLDADFLSGGPENVRYQHDFIERRRLARLEGETREDMNRLYTVESTATNTGAKADHRIPMQPSRIEGFTRLLADRLGVEAGAVDEAAFGEEDRRILDALAADLQAHRGRGLVIAGEAQPAAVHALAHAMNAQLGNAGRTVSYIPPVEARPQDQLQGLRGLVDAMNNGQVKVLAIVGANPVYTAPADLRFAQALAKVPFSAHLSLYRDETSQVCTWHIPEAHYLESWSDARALDGTATIIQPIIAPLYGGRTSHEFVAAFTDQPDQTSYDLVRGFWESQRRGGDFESFWRQAVHDGVVPGTAFRPVSPPPVLAGLAGRLGAPRPPAPEGQLEIVFRRDPSVYDGRFANNGWLQELPRPLTKLTWDNAALMAPATAERLGLQNEDVVELTLQGRTVRAPVLMLPGSAPDTVTAHVGYGRTPGFAGRVAGEAGYSAYALRSTQAPWFGSGLELTKLNERYRLATTQDHFSLEGRNHVRSASLTEYRANPDFAHDLEHVAEERADFYPDYDYKQSPNKWGMSIDLLACVGCNACVVACQSENNIPIVGKKEVLNGREMHWLRIDTYYRGVEPDNPDATYYQPMLCQHCEKAPCEVVCPVYATVHGPEGLNQMIYNRCIGTRYCSNNCPYKVRRFNFLNWHNEQPIQLEPSMNLWRNPDVTVREKGVMEKCTYCVQRISLARINAEREDREIGGDEVRTACQAACPSEAIVFGDMNVRDSTVNKMKALELNYAVLSELNTYPRTTYLAEVRNPNPTIAGEETHGEEEGH
jgi:molybdopterin-containing oxidoreductase family iron-sulfur binding subunit